MTRTSLSYGVSGRWPEKFPFTDADFRRQDESDDVVFYKEARLVTHIDDKGSVFLLCRCVRKALSGTDVSYVNTSY